jgi:hypothetical protein
MPTLTAPRPDTGAVEPTVAVRSGSPFTQQLAWLIPAGMVLALWLAVIPAQGGYFPRTWYPLALGAVLLLAGLRIAGRAPLPAHVLPRVALGLLAALVAWAFLSIAWAGSPGAAWAAADKLVLVLAMAAILSVIPWTGRALATVLGIWALGVAALCAGRLVTWLGASDLLRFFEPASLRMNDPLGYPNATAALPAMAMLAALTVASLREIPAWARAAALPVTVFLAEFALFAQSRGALGGVVVAALVLVAFSAQRLRLLLRLAVVLALAAPAAGPILDVGHAAVAGRDIAAPLDHAAKLIAVTVVLAAAIGALLAFADARVRISRGTARAGRVAAVVLVLVAGVGLTTAYGGRARTWVHDTWVQRSNLDAGKSRLLSLNFEERPDYARVALELFRAHPVAGVGAGNFGREYDARRRYDKHSRYAHDLWLRILSEQGLVGLVLFLGMLGAIVGGLVVRRRTLGPLERTVAAGCLAVGAYLLAHGSLDWLEEYPALAMPAAALPFAALALFTPRGRQGRPRRLTSVAGAVALGAVIASLVPAWMAVRFLDRAGSERAANPTAAFADMRRAGSWNPLSPDPEIAEGALALSLGDPTRARLAFRRAIDRELNWFSYLQLALVEGGQRHWGQADTLLDQASALSANDRVIAVARKVVGARHQVDPEAINGTVFDSPLFRSGKMP